MGTGAAFDGAIFASYTKSIVVTINYRLGPFGKSNRRRRRARRRRRGKISTFYHMHSLVDQHLSLSLSIFYFNEQQLTIAIVVRGLIKVLLFPVYFTQLMIANR